MEVKVDAPLSGDQLSRYLDAASKRDHEVTVILACPYRFPCIPAEVQYRPWQSLWMILDSRIPKTLDLWLELKSLLESIGMADEFGTPFSREEIGALALTYSLYRKLGRMLTQTPAKVEASGLLRQCDYSEACVLRTLRAQFHYHRRWMVGLPTDSDLQVLVGAWPANDGIHSPQFDSPQVGVWVEVDPKNRQVAEAARKALAPLSESSGWSAPRHPWILICRSKNLEPASNDLSGELLEWLGQLKGMGIFTLKVADSDHLA